MRSTGHIETYIPKAVLEKMEIKGRYVAIQLSFEVEFKIQACEGWQ